MGELLQLTRPDDPLIPRTVCCSDGVAARLSFLCFLMLLWLKLCSSGLLYYCPAFFFDICPYCPVTSLKYLSPTFLSGSSPSNPPSCSWSDVWTLGSAEAPCSAYPPFLSFPRAFSLFSPGVWSPLHFPHVSSLYTRSSVPRIIAHYWLHSALDPFGEDFLPNDNFLLCVIATSPSLSPLVVIIPGGWGRGVCQPLWLTVPLFDSTTTDFCGGAD